LVYSALRTGFFTIARSNVVNSSLTQQLSQNTAAFVDTTLTVNGLWAVVLIGIPFCMLAGRRGLYVLGSTLGPFLVIVLLGRELLDRHMGVFMPLLPVVAAIGWSQLAGRLTIPNLKVRWAVAVGGIAFSLLWAWT